MRTTHSKFACDSTRPLRSNSGEIGSKAAHGRAEGMPVGCRRGWRDVPGYTKNLLFLVFILKMKRILQ